MAISPYSSLLLLIFIFLPLTHFHSLSHASPNHIPNRLRLRTAVRKSTSAAANGGAGAATVELWCVAKNNAEDSALQSALDWACGPGGTNCGPIQQGGPCYDPANIQDTASYAFNDYFLRNGMTPDSCNFDGTAALTSLNPSHGSCKFASSLTAKNGSFAGSSTTMGFGPNSADTSFVGGNYNAGIKFWTLITIYLFYGITLVF